ncbi:lytic transglycosylase domain-containing protein, partial [Patulibacter sp.]|uniref:lytic transglycosylase domain-containing protein n=1 Tax=Patulibacter sp. TaxID=1912859 RepID=UPI00271B5F37
MRRRTGAAAVVAAGLLVAPGAHAATTTTGPTPAARASTTGPAPAADPAATPDAVDPVAQPPASTTADPAVPPASTTTTPAAPSDDADGVRDDDSLGDDSGGAGRAETAKAQRARERREARQALAKKHAAAARRRAAARKKAAKEAREKAKAEREADGDTAEDPTDAADAADGAGGTAGDAADPSLLGGDAELLRAPTAIPDLFIARFRIPPFLLPIYQAAGVEYGIRWEVLAAINEIETDYGRNLNVSTAGAQGWMQFMPATWKTYGTDADGDGQADPMDPVDAIFSAARYLKAAGAEDSIRKAIFAYNHADWYVDSVMLRARLISGLPEPLVSSLTGLAQGVLPVEGAVADPDAPGASPVAAGTPAPAA